MLVLITCKYEKDRTINSRKKWRHHLSHYKSMGVFFRRSGAVNSVVGGPIWPKFKLVRDIMDVLVTYKFKMDLSIATERRSRAANSQVSSGIWPKFKLIQAFMHVLITCNYQKDHTLNSRDKVATPSFPL